MSFSKKNPKRKKKIKATIVMQAVSHTRDAEM